MFIKKGDDLYGCEISLKVICENVQTTEIIVIIFVTMNGHTSCMYKQCINYSKSYLMVFKPRSNGEINMA